MSVNGSDPTSTFISAWQADSVRTLLANLHARETWCWNCEKLHAYLPSKGPNFNYNSAFISSVPDLATCLSHSTAWFYIGMYSVRISTWTSVMKTEVLCGFLQFLQAYSDSTCRMATNASSQTFPIPVNWNYTVCILKTSQNKSFRRKWSNVKSNKQIRT